MSNDTFLRLERALKKLPTPWPVTMTYKHVFDQNGLRVEPKPGHCFVEFEGLSREALNVFIAELLMSG